MEKNKLHAVVFHAELCDEDGYRVSIDAELETVYIFNSYKELIYFVHKQICNSEEFDEALDYINECERKELDIINKETICSTDNFNFLEKVINKTDDWHGDTTGEPLFSIFPALLSSKFYLAVNVKEN